MTRRAPAGAERRHRPAEVAGIAARAPRRGTPRGARSARQSGVVDRRPARDLAEWRSFAWRRAWRVRADRSIFAPCPAARPATIRAQDQTPSHAAPGTPPRSPLATARARQRQLRASRRCCSSTAAIATLVLGAVSSCPGSPRGATPRTRCRCAGTATSGGRETLFVAGLDDYAADVEHVASALPAPPVLIGHSMGAAVVERLLGAHPVRAAALIAPVPPAGLLPMAARLATRAPRLPDADGPARPGAPRRRQSSTTLRPFYFSDDVDPEILARGGAAPGRGIAARAARPVAAAALAAAGARAASRCS